MVSNRTSDNLHLENVILLGFWKKFRHDFETRSILWTNRDSCDFKNFVFKNETFSWKEERQDSKALNELENLFNSVNRATRKVGRRLLDDAAEMSTIFFICSLLISTCLTREWRESKCYKTVACFSSCLRFFFFLIHEKLIFLVTRARTRDKKISRESFSKISSYASTLCSVVKYNVFPLNNIPKRM